MTYTQFIRNFARNHPRQTLMLAILYRNERRSQRKLASFS